MKTTRIDDLRCAGCGAELNAHSDVLGTRTPRPGDLSVCMHCGELNVFCLDGLRLAAPEVIDAVHPQMRRVIEAVRNQPEVRQRRARRN